MSSLRLISHFCRQTKTFESGGLFLLVVSIFVNETKFQHSKHTPWTSVSRVFCFFFAYEHCQNQCMSFSRSTFLAKDDVVFHLFESSLRGLLPPNVLCEETTTLCTCKKLERVWHYLYDGQETRNLPVTIFVETPHVINPNACCWHSDVLFAFTKYTLVTTDMREVLVMIVIFALVKVYNLWKN